ncbi:sialidase family protein [Luteimonas deserti]|uniref:Exo-alpha-sialidase n=1 Tax=Luteimonas deserti TaxID=2752306 RepID=A0A7Z0TZB6_9GAMM|nr:sialidase family protein [Luteimonas deserti]NYZ62063.1 exo-alpha-sialidase [Luteimonas deserti]
MPIRFSAPKHRLPALAALALTLAACAGGNDAAPDGAAGTSGPPPAVDAPSERIEWALPETGPGSSAPDLAASSDGHLVLSWTNSRAGRRHVFQFSRFDPAAQAWRTAPTTIAIGNRMFVNWADTPHVMPTADGALWAHWLQRNGEGRYAYDVVLARSRDGGANWGAPVVPHDDGTQTEHGFVSMWPQGDGIGIAWLDGRNTTGASHEGHEGVEGHAGSGRPMTLRAARFDAAMRRIDEHEIDASVCDCCHTAAAVTTRGPVVVYRGRTDGEVRDILVTRFEGSAWTPPRAVHADAWVMPACPVNGPSVAARGDTVLVGWYTAPGDESRVRLARSDDAGDSFSAPVELDAGSEVQGRIAVALDDTQAWAVWLREDADGAQALWLSRRSADLATEHERVELARLQGRGRATGFPQLQVVGRNAYVVWIDVVDGAPQLRGMRLQR